MFGIVIGLMEDEYGYVSLNEMSDLEIDLAKRGLGKGSKKRPAGSSRTRQVKVCGIVTNTPFSNNFTCQGFDD